MLAGPSRSLTAVARRHLVPPFACPSLKESALIIVPAEAESTAARLAAALQAVPGVPSSMVVLAGAGYYDDFKSSLATPELQLIADLRALVRDPGTPRDSRQLIGALVQRVYKGDFDATSAESAAWMRSEEGQQTLRELTGQEPAAG
jgi:hypothetical protein